MREKLSEVAERRRRSQRERKKVRTLTRKDMIRRMSGEYEPVSIRGSIKKLSWPRARIEHQKLPQNPMSLQIRFGMRKVERS